MKSIMSVNHKFYDYSPKELLELVKDYKVDGFEIFNNGKDDFDYLSALAYECSIHNKVFQIHADSSLDAESQIEFLHHVESLYEQLGYKINIVLHPLIDEDKNKAIELTDEYMKKITSNVDNNKLQITIENLNDVPFFDRLDKQEITPIICNNEDLYFTYDIGHEIADRGPITDTNEALIPLIKNVHIHTNDAVYDDGYDHKPIFKDDEFFGQIVKAITYLNLIKYDGPVVYEYDLYMLPGENKKEQIINYAKSMQTVSERFS